MKMLPQAAEGRAPHRSVVRFCPDVSLTGNPVLAKVLDDFPLRGQEGRFPRQVHGSCLCMDQRGTRASARKRRLLLKFCFGEYVNAWDAGWCVPVVVGLAGRLPVGSAG